MNTKYCIMCEQTLNDESHVHFFDYVNYDKCFGPYAYAPTPPELTEDDWEWIFSNEQIQLKSQLEGLYVQHYPQDNSCFASA